MHSALGLSVADSLMLGCQPVIVEGSSDQHYLTAIKTLLVASGRLKPGAGVRVPTGRRTKNTRMVASILTGRDEALPFMILDGDMMGRKLAKELGSSLYQEHADRLVSVDDHTGMDGSEIEDLIPTDVWRPSSTACYRNADTEFADTLVPESRFSVRSRRGLRRRGSTRARLEGGALQEVKQHSSPRVWPS